MKSIGVGIIGLSAQGGWAAGAHVPALRALAGFELRACSASTPESAKAAALAHGVAVACADHHELVARSDVDLVVVAVKVPHHHLLVSAGIAAGKAVLCEWPLGNGLAEAEDLASRADAAGVLAFVGLQARSAPPIRAVRELVTSGILGKIMSSTLIGSGDQWGAEVDGPNAYLVDRGNGATLLSIPFGHTIDALGHVLGTVTDVRATTATRRPQVRRTDTGELIAMSAEDQIAVTATLRGSDLVDGAVLAAHYRGGRSAAGGLRWEISGSEADLLVRGRTGHLQFGLVDLEISDPGRTIMTPYQVPARFHTSGVEANTRATSVAEAYVQIAAALRGLPHEAPTFADAVANHALLDAIQRSAATGERVVP
ncbi:MAG: Gfo/Idh/MocA family protein [Sporichthyaceae bacterium]